jgi:hypothetical protein
VFAVCGAVSCRVSGFSAWVALAPPSAVHPAAGAERGCPSTARAMVALCAGRPHPRLLPLLQLHWEAVQDVVRRGGSDDVLHGLAFTPAARTGAKTSSCALVQPLPTGAEVIAAPAGLMWSLPLVRLPTAEVVASAGETVSATCCRSFGSLALMALLLPPIGGRGRGPIRSSACPEAIAAAV